MRQLNVYLIIFFISMLFSAKNGFSQHWTIKGAQIEGNQPFSQFARDLAMSKDGSTILIKATANGDVQAYEWTSALWAKKGQVIETVSYSIGPGTVALNANGTIMVVEENPTNNIGAVKVLEWNGSSWIQKGSILTGTTVYGNFGESLTASNDGLTIAIGAPDNDDTFASAGAVFIYKWNGSDWQQQGSTLYGDADYNYFGTGLDLNDDGTIVAIGAPDNDNVNGNAAGHAKIFSWNGTNWIQMGNNINGEALANDCGNSVSLNGDGQTVLVADWRNDQNTGQTSSNDGHIRVYDYNGSNWIQRGNDIDGEDGEFGTSTDISSDGNIVIGGGSFNSAIETSAGAVETYRWDGSVWIPFGQIIYGEEYEYIGRAVHMTSDGNSFIVDGNGFNVAGNSVGRARIYKRSNVWGKLFLDLNANCAQETNEIGLTNKTVIVQPGNHTLQTDMTGTWGIDSLQPGTYTVYPDTTNGWSTTCAGPFTFVITSTNDYVDAGEIGLVADNPCTDPSVSIVMPFMRPCFTDQSVFVTACNNNNGTEMINGGYVDVELDTMLDLTSATLPYSNISGNIYRFNVGNIAPGECVEFKILTDLNCNAQLGQTVCMDAKLYPIDSCALDTISAGPTEVSPCTTPWDKSSLSVDGFCLNDSIHFTVTNTGDFGNGDMDCFAPIRLFIDGQYVVLDSIQLLGQETATFIYPGTGQAFRFEADQHPLHPGNSHPNAHIELCGTDSTWTPDLINVLPMDDADPMTDVYCGVVTGSYDPNDKTGFPLGLTDQHYILPNQKLDYLIRFQNTGTDTAFTVVVRDTLEADLDIFSVVSGTSSNNYDFKIHGNRVLEWTFNNILLPDSTTNEPASHGFISFTVNQVKDLTNGTEINNEVGIYFDFNDPIITNTTSHIIDDGILTPPLGSVGVIESIAGMFTLYPNPTKGTFQIKLKQSKQDITITIRDVAGKVVFNQTNMNGSVFNLSPELETKGLYFVEVKTADYKEITKLVRL